jgi:AcrR family transcriptional regulator
VPRGIRLSKRQQQAAATAEQLLCAARAVFEARGYRGATVGAITRAAATAHGTFYLHFHNKEDAFRRVMAEVCDEIYQQASGPVGSDPRAGLEAAIGGYLEVFASHRGLFRALLEGALASQTVEQMWLALRRPFVERIAKTVLRLDPDRGLDEALLAAQALGSMVEWFAFLHFVFGEPPEREVPRALAVDTIVGLWLSGLAPGAASVGAARSPGLDRNA